MVLVFYISGHGFGHATRTLTVIDEIRRRQPDARIVIRSMVPAAFLERSASGPIDIQPTETDTGVAQIDSLRPDEEETWRRASAFYAHFSDRVDAEAQLLTRIGVSVVVGDVPPLAFAAAAQAGIPSVAVANFTWDWIYAAYPSFATQAPEVIPLMREAYAAADLALRLPFAGGFASMRTVRDVPLVARRSALGRDAARALLKLDDRRPIVLASFGGHDTRLPYEDIARQHDITLVVTDHETARRPHLGHDERLRVFSNATLLEEGVCYDDLVAAADLVVSKPGYGIVSECIANETALLHTSRGPFAENDVLVNAMAPFLRSAHIPQDDLRAGRWQPAIERLLRQPPPAASMDTRGASVVADAILALVRTRSHDAGRL